MAAHEILVVDDEAGIRQGCRRVLEPQGFRVQSAASLGEAREKLAAEKFAVVLLDVMMPDGQGIELIEPIQEMDPDVVTVVITGYATVELAVEAIRRGAYDFIAKPFTADVLLLTVSRALEKRSLSLEARRLQEIEKEAEAQARANEEAERLLAFKTTFAYIVAHELRTPVAAAQSLLRVLLRGLAGELSPQQQEIVVRVDGRLDNLLALVNDLLLLAASKTVVDETPLRRLPLQPALEAVLRRLGPEADENELAVTTTMPDELLFVRATEEGLERILANIVGNAFKYTSHVSNVKDVKITLTREGEEAVITVADSGIGIPKAALEQLGREFYRAPNAKQAGVGGTGLGLSIVKQHLEHCGGTITFASEEGQGTTVTIRLPLETTTKTPSAATPAQALI
jgi:two-component system, sensor histidine kinase and response regulator